MRVPLGPIADIPEDRCVAVGDGAAVVFRVDGEVRAFSGRCLHQDSSLDGGWIRDGVLSCPQHFWRYTVTDGRLVGSGRTAEHPEPARSESALELFPVTVIDGYGYVEVPDLQPELSFRERQLKHARTWRADGQRDGREA
jgi:nitrite reductase/ring-hydroxylating ferredoxin subunit